MDILAIINEFGIPISVALSFGFFIWKQNKFIQDELMEEIDERFKREESILIKLIDNAKNNEIKLTDLDGSVKLLIHYLAEEKAKNKERLLKKIKEVC